MIIDLGVTATILVPVSLVMIQVYSLQAFPYCGSYLPEDLAYQMALGNVDLNSLDIVGFYDPGELQ